MVFKVVRLKKKKKSSSKYLTHSRFFQITPKNKDWGKGGRPHISFSSSSWSATSSWTTLGWNVFKCSQKIFYEGVPFNLLPAEVFLRYEVGLKWSDEWNQKQPLLQRTRHQTCSLHLGRVKQTSETEFCLLLDLKCQMYIRVCVCVLATWSGQPLYIWAFKILVYVIFHSRNLDLFWGLAVLIHHSNLQQIIFW